MNIATEPVSVNNRLGRAVGRPAERGSWLCPSGRPLVCLPILTRSAALLTLLLDDAAVDVELVNSIVVLDPGLAFATLQLASPDGEAATGVSHSLPLAVVAAGRDQLLEVVRRASLLDAGLTSDAKAHLQRLFLRSARRACVALFLGRELGDVEPDQCYLAGLLSNLPGMVALTANRDLVLAQITLQKALRSSLQPEVFAAISEAAATSPKRPCSAISASLSIANSMLEPADGEDPRHLATLAASPLWAPWASTTLHRRTLLLGKCCAVAAWAAAQVQRLAPWEFATRLQRKLWGVSDANPAHLAGTLLTVTRDHPCL